MSSSLGVILFTVISGVAGPKSTSVNKPPESPSNIASRAYPSTPFVDMSIHISEVTGNKVLYSICIHA